MNPLIYKDLSASVLTSLSSLTLTYPSLSQLSVNSLPQPILFRSDWLPLQNSHIALITGGGAGHEPAHAQYVGPGMLTAAVSGQIFASPSVQLIADTIDALVPSSGPGCLLIVKNYTGDRLNFGLACEQAKAKGIQARMLIVEDDCSIDPMKGVTGRRGVAGTVLVHKIAGAIADQKGVSLDELYNRVLSITERIRTIGAALSSCAIPGRANENRIKPGFVELGLGIHNEPGVETVEFNDDIGGLVGRMMKKLMGEYKNSKENGFIVLVNNLGSCTSMEMGVIVSEVYDFFNGQLKRSPIRVYSGAYMTSFDMKGFSITLLETDQSHEKEFLGYLDHSVNAPGWLNFHYGASNDKQRVFDFKKAVKKQLKSTVEGKNTLGIVIETVCQKLLGLENELNLLDAKVGDGDCGSTLALGSKTILTDLWEYPLQDIPCTLEAITSTIEKSMGGTSGVIFRIFFTALAHYFGASPKELSPLSRWKMALEGALESLLTYDNAREGHRTLLDALIPAIKAFGVSEKEAVSVKMAWEAAQKGAEKTKGMKAGAGRSNYVPEEILKEFEDPGAKAVAAIWEGIYQVLEK